MSKELGDQAGGGAYTVTTNPGDGTVTAGQAVAIDQSDGQAKAGDTDTAAIDQLAGVAAEDFGDAGDGEAIVLDGVVIAVVDTGVTAGARLGLGNATGTTTGTLIDADGGPALALSDEGGVYKGYDLPAGAAAVHL